MLDIKFIRENADKMKKGATDKGIDPKLVDKLLKVDKQRSQLIQEVKNRSQRHDLDAQLLELAITSIAESKYDPWELCVGEDLMSILAVGLIRVLGTNSATAVKPEGLKRSLRLAYSESDFDSSDVATAMQEWEMRNGPFQIR